MSGFITTRSIVPADQRRSLPGNPRVIGEPSEVGSGVRRCGTVGRVLLGRELECAAIGRLLDEAREGASGGILLRGDAGIGKTALVEYAVDRAAGMLVVRAQGVQSEAEVAFGGLLEVARPLLARIDGIPERQAAALRAALALDDGPSPDRLTVGAATLSLLAAAAEETPLLVALDDAHWLDVESAEALGFAVRRLQAERVAVVVATRVGEGRGFDPRASWSSTFRGCRARMLASSSSRTVCPAPTRRRDSMR